MYHQFRELADVDITKEPMEVGPTCHYMMGGIRVEAETAQSTVPGLFAAGEAAAGLHGANRLGGNSLSDLLVFGRRAGLAAAEHSKGVGLASIDVEQIGLAEREMIAPFDRSAGSSPYELHRQLQETMQNYVGIFRTQEDLIKGLSEIRRLQQETEHVRVEGSRLFNPGWHLARDLKSMLLVSEAVALSALERKESRGAHSRIDYPKYDETLGKQNNIVVREGESMRLRQREIPEMPPELKRIVEEQ
jgi:succinate dehydrogenase / fumarate reductase flavoprotein subunit